MPKRKVNISSLDDIFAELQQDNEEQEIPSLHDSLLREFSEGLNQSPEEQKKTWKPTVGAQTDAFYSEAFETLYGGAAGGGKLLANDTLVPIINGVFKRADEIKVGDMLISADGGATKVLAVYPHKDIELYRFKFIDNSEIVTGGEHLWLYWTASKRVKAKRHYLLYSPEKGLRRVPVRGKLGMTKDIAKYHKGQEENQKNGKRPYWVIIPTTKPIRFTKIINRADRSKLIDPYLLGLLIGDGTISRDAIKITTKDTEIINAVTNMERDFNVRWDGNKTIHISNSKSLIEKLKHWGLHGTYSGTKFIPKTYLYLPIKDRLALVQGLIDTDGHVDDRGHVSYTTVSKQLAEDVRQLLMSLGAKVTVTEKAGSYRDKNGEIVECQLAYTLFIQAKDCSQFCRLSRKKERCRSYNGGVSEVGRRLIGVEYVGRGDGVCFAIDHPSGLHLATKDFIVTHNTDLMVGLAASPLSPHKKAIVFRSTYKEHKDFVRRVQEVAPESTYKGGNQEIFTDLPNGKTLELGSVANFAAAQKYRGRPHDLKMFDEVCKIPEEVYTFLIAWTRTTEEGVPTRVLAAGNPPTTPNEEWVIRRWAAWLDKNHKNPAKPKELRWYATLDGMDTEITPEISEEGCQGKPFDYTDKKGKTEKIFPRSRTFIPARVTDNPYLMKTNYMEVLQNLDEPFRSQLLYGEFKPTEDTDVWRIVPVDWYDLAVQRYVHGKESGDMELNRAVNPAFGLDVSEGTQDKTVLVRLGGQYVQVIYEIEGKTQETQVMNIKKATKHYRRSVIGVDVIGTGFGMAEMLEKHGERVLRIKGSKKSTKVDKATGYKFYNTRCEMFWMLREAFNPDSENPIAVPPNNALKEEILSARFSIVFMNGEETIKVDSKEEIKKRIRRSPDTADALLNAIKVRRSIHTPLRIF